MKLRIGLPFKIAFISFFIGSLGVAGISFMAYQSVDKTLQNHAIQYMIQDVRRETQRVKLVFSSMKEDIVFLSGSFSMDVEKGNHSRISTLLSTVMQERPLYDSIRYLRNSENGAEEINISKKNGQTVLVPQKHSRPLAENPYFATIMDLKKGQVHFSEIGPESFSFATTIRDGDKRPKGIILVHVSMERLIAPLRNHANGISFFLAGNMGNFILGAELDPESRKQILASVAFPGKNPAPTGSVYGKTFRFESGNGGGYAARVQVDPSSPDNFMILGSVASFSYLKKESIAHGYLIFSAAGITLVLLLVSTALGAIVVTRPIKKLTRVTRKIIDGDESLQITVRGNDEVAELSMSMKIMLEKLLRSRNRLKEFNQNLEHEVAARTSAYADANQKLHEEIVSRTQIEESLKLYRKFFDESCEAMVVTDTSGTIIEVNEAFVEMAGFPREEILGKNPRILKSGRHEPEFYEKMWNEISDRGFWRGEIWDRRKNGEVYPKWMSISTLTDDSGKTTHYVALSTDISTVKNAEKKLAHLAQYDQLTNTPNRILLKDRINNALINAERKHCQVAVMVVNLDGFKGINEMFGHKAGDNLLVETARRLSGSVRKSDTVARLSGDEFAVIIDDINMAGNAAICAEKLLESFASPFILEGQDIYVSASIGISIFPTDSTHPEELLKRADTAMHHVKRKETNNFLFFSEELNAEAGERLMMNAMLRKSMELDELSLNYQPKIDLTTGRVTGMEALLRWNHPEHGFISPGKFIPVAEETGLIIPMGKWALHEACKQTKLWIDQGLTGLKISVNLSARQLQLKDTIIGTVGKVLHKTGLPPECLELEITESMLMLDVEETIRILKILRDMGVGLAIDDFGTGYSSLSYLKRFPIDVLKIDRSFIIDLAKDSNDRAVITSIIDMAKNMNLKVIAEGVEEKEQLSFLEEHGCNEIQGYIFSKPLPADEFTAYVKGFHMKEYTR